MKKIFIFMIIFFITSVTHAASPDKNRSTYAIGSTVENLTLTTYYPSPYGEYREVRIHPQPHRLDADCNADTEGLMYYDQDNGLFLICRNIDTTGSTGQYVWSTTDNVWRRDGNNIFLANHEDALVGIGTDTPDDKLTVEDGYIHVNNTNAAGGMWGTIKLEGNVNGGGGGRILFYHPGMPNSRDGVIQGVGGSLSVVGTNELRLYANGDGTRRSQMYFGPDGNIGLGVDLHYRLPAAAFEVNGSIMTTPLPSDVHGPGNVILYTVPVPPCGGLQRGSIYFDDVQDKFKGCTSTGWVDLSP